MVTTRSLAPQRWVEWRNWPTWGTVLALYALSRVFSTVLLGTMYSVANSQGWTFASHRDNSTFFTFSGSWDTWFYRQIGLHGYPTELPTDAVGNVMPNAWAFLPVFPTVTRGVMNATGLDFYVAGVLVATLFGAAAAYVLFRLVESRVGATPALWAVALFSFGPLAFVLQVAYAESMFLFLLFCSLWAMVKQRYLLMIPFAVVAAFTRPGGLAVALALGIVFVVRYLNWRRRSEPFPWSARIRMIVAAAAISVAGLAWPVIASAVTAYPGAYLETELSWWTGFVGRQEFIPLTPWFLLTGKYLGVVGILLVFVVIGSFVWWLTRPGPRALGTDLVAYSASYGLYLVAVFLPQQSLFRLLMPLAPLLGDPTIAGSVRIRRTLLIGGMVLQPVAIVLLWFLGYP